MSALFTHYEYGKEVLNKLSDKQKDEINNNIDYYNMFNQGWDNLFYYLPKWHKIKKIGLNAHKNNVDNFFKNMIIYIKENNLEDNSMYTNMVYGFINHYVMDNIIHPYVNYLVKSINMPHSKIEFMLDSKIRKDNKNSYFRVAIPKIKNNKEFTNYLDLLFLKTYGVKNIGKKFIKSHNISYYLYRYFINDKHGIKRFIYKLFWFIKPTEDNKLYEFTYYYKIFDKRILNEERNIWNHPKKKNEKYNYSFNELYNYSIDIAVKLNNIAYNIIHNNDNINKLISLIKIVDTNNIDKLLKK